MNPDKKLVDRLLNAFVYEKQKLLEASGYRGQLDLRRVRGTMLSRIEQMANVVREWSVCPDILMEAVFAWAKYNRHPGGPMPNMLLSAKYLTNALSHHLQIPFEVVVQNRGQEAYMTAQNAGLERVKAELSRAGVTDVATATSYPIEIRYLIAQQAGDVDAMYYMSQELLARMADDRRTSAWLRMHNVSYEDVAAKFNLRKSL